MAEARKTSWVLSFDDKATKGIEKVDKSFTSLTKKMDKFDGHRALKGIESGAKQASKGLASLSSQFRGVSMVATGVAVKATKDFMDYSSTLSTVKSQAGATADEIDRLNNAIMSMDKKLSSKALAEQAVTLSSAGLAMKEVEAALPAVDKISVLTEDDTSAPEVLLAGRTHLGVDLGDTKQIEQFSNELAKAQSLANFNIADISESLVTGGASFNAFNMGSRESAATLTVLAELGYKGSQAGTMLNATLTDLISKSEDGAIAFGKQKVALYDANGQMKQLPTIMSEISQATSDMSEEQRNAAMNQVFGAQSSKLVNNWVSKGTDIYRENANALKDVNGQLDTMVGDKTDNLTWDLKSLGNSFKDRSISITEEIAPSLRGFVQGIEGVTTKIQGASPVVQKMIGWGTLIAVAAAPVLKLGSLLFSGIGAIAGGAAFLFAKLSLLPTALGVLGLSVKSAMAGINFALLGTVGWVGAIGIAVVGLGVTIYRNWDSIKSWTSDLATKVKSSWNSMGEKVRETVDNVKSWWTSLKEFLSAPISGVVNIFRRDKGDKKDDKKPKHKTGKDRIPRDGYDFIGHKDEMVLTRSVANAYRKAGGTSTSLPSTNSGGGGSNVVVNVPSITVNTTGKDAYNDGRQAGRGVTDEIDNYFKKMGLVV